MCKCVTRLIHTCDINHVYVTPSVSPRISFKGGRQLTKSFHLCVTGEMARSTTFRAEAHVPYQMMSEGPHSTTRAGSWKFDTRPQNNGSTIQICFDPVAQILGEHTRLANDAQVRLCLDCSWVWVAVRCSVLHRVLACCSVLQESTHALPTVQVRYGLDCGCVT